MVLCGIPPGDRHCAQRLLAAHLGPRRPHVLRLTFTTARHGYPLPSSLAVPSRYPASPGEHMRTYPLRMTIYQTLWKAKSYAACGPLDTCWLPSLQTWSHKQSRHPTFPSKTVLFSDPDLGLVFAAVVFPFAVLEPLRPTSHNLGLRVPN